MSDESRRTGDSAHDDPTMAGDAAGVGPTRPVTPFVPRPRTPGASRMAPAAIIAGRIRLGALLGSGGMGEVYRADDLTLDQPVALKFLPEGVAADPAQLAQFHNELRTARQVSHKNVVRVYDLGESDGRRFLTLEYVDGEDLASLLRRIGRFPQDRALAIARQLCAGVAAAHERGVIHRDLKPHNVMIDGDGDVRITDFGIATAAADAGAALAGTPQYMAPEQLAGSAASVKSDLYSLGLCLFEIFTGKRAYEARSITDLKALHDTGTLTTPSSIVPDLDPATEAVIMGGPDRDTQKRPASALAIAAALPGGEPLAAALAAGETPSPEVLSAAAESEAIPVLTGIGLVTATLVCVIAYALISPRGTMASLAPLEKAPEVLADRARQVLADFGYAEAPADTAQRFIIPPDFGRWVVTRDETNGRWDPARQPMSSGILFWYRTSPQPMFPNRSSNTVSPTDPPFDLTGQSLVVLDTKGRLVEFRRVPPQLRPPGGLAAEPQWDAVFRAAGLDRTAFTPVESEWSPKDFADTRAAWDGPLPDAFGLRLRVEAAAYRGQLVSVFVVAPWSRARAMTPISSGGGSAQLRVLIVITVNIALLLGAVLVARHNLRGSRADRKGAARLLSVYLALVLLAWIVDGHHVWDAGIEFNGLLKTTAALCLQCGILWVLYIALEPYGRRFWPDGLLGWSRLLSGHLRDPRTGREILIGAALGGALLLVDLFRSLSPSLIGRPPGVPTLGTQVEALGGAGPMYGAWVDVLFSSLQTALFFVLLLIVARLVIGRPWLALALTLVVEVLIAGGGTPPGGVAWLYYVTNFIALALINLAILRYGLLVTALMILLDNIPSAIPIVPHGPQWASLPGTLSLLVVIAAAAFGFYAARAGQPLLGRFDA